MVKTNNKQVNLVEKKYAFEKRRKRRRPYIPVDQALPKPRRTITRRLAKKHRKIIDYWNNIGQPFSEVRKKEVLAVPLSKALRECSNDPRQVNFVIQKAHLYFSSNYFVYKLRSGPTKNIRLYDFLVLNQFQMRGQFLISKGFKSWFEVFLTKDEQWLSEYLIRLPKFRKTKEYDPKIIYEKIKEILEIKKIEWKWKSHLITITNRLMEFCEVNNGYSITAGLSDFEQYIKHEVKQQAKPYWFVSDNFWNMRFKPFIVKVGRFQDERYITEI